jgi:type I restriction enzyme S subunit
MYKGKTNGFDVNFIKYFFLTKKGKELLEMASPGGAGRNKTLGQKEFENLEFLLPETVEEQIRISNCLTSIATRIETQTKKLDVLMSHKKGLMRQLFPIQDEVQR